MCNNNNLHLGICTNFVLMISNEVFELGILLWICKKSYLFLIEKSILQNYIFPKSIGLSIFYGRISIFKKKEIFHENCFKKLEQMIRPIFFKRGIINATVGPTN